MLEWSKIILYATAIYNAQSPKYNKEIMNILLQLPS